MRHERGDDRDADLGTLAIRAVEAEVMVHGGIAFRLRLPQGLFVKVRIAIGVRARTALCASPVFQGTRQVQSRQAGVAERRHLPL